MKDTQEVIHSIMRAELYHHPDGNKKPASLLPLVTISRFYGSNDEEIAKCLAERLQVNLYDKLLLERMINVSHANPTIFSKIDEHVLPMIDELFYEAFSMQGANTNDYYYYLMHTLIDIMREGGVIVGRAAHILIPKGRAFRLRLEGSLTMCAQRVAAQQGMTIQNAKRKIREVNTEREKFVRATFERYGNQRSYYDMVINTDLYSAEDAADLIIFAMKTANFKIPEYSQTEPEYQDEPDLMVVA